MVILLILAIFIINNKTKTGYYFLNNSNNKIKIGVITMLSGDYSIVGEQVARSINLTLDKLPDRNNFEFIYEDGQCDKVMSINAARKLINVDKVQIIISAGCSDTTVAIAPIVNSEKIVTIMPSTGGTNIDNAGEYIFRNGNSDINSAIQPAMDFINKFNYKKVALITDSTEAMQDIRLNFKKAYIKLGGTVSIDDLVSSNEKDFRTIISKIKDSNVDVVFINSQTGLTGAYFIKQAKVLNLNKPIFTNFNTATNTETYKITNNLIDGVYFYEPAYNQNSKQVINFLNNYKKEYGSLPPLLFHAITTHDAVIMSIQAIKNVGNNGEKIHNWLLNNIKDWNGLIGSVTFDNNGNSNTGYVLKRIEDKSVVKIEDVE